MVKPEEPHPLPPVVLAIKWAHSPTAILLFRAGQGREAAEDGESEKRFSSS